MPNTSVLRVGRVVATILIVALACVAQFAQGQTSQGNVLPNGLLPMLSNQPAASPVSTAVYQQPVNMPNMPRRMPMARLIQNPDQTDGAPPFALTDQSGTIQRYVEPVPGVELAAHVGQVVTVRNDTGTTLLASQLELQPAAMRPMGNPGERYAAATDASGSWRRNADPVNAVQQVQYVDNDDASVQLLPEEGAPMDQNGMAGGMQPMDGIQPMGQFPAYAEQVGPPPMVGPMYQPNMPMEYPPGMMGYPTNECDAQPTRARISADVELMMLRPQIAESAVGKISEDYQFSPRFILGLQGAGNFDGRLRYWHYDRNSEVLSGSLAADRRLGQFLPYYYLNNVDYMGHLRPLSASPAKGSIRIKFDVLDIEAVHHFAARKSELTLSGGLRLAGIHLTDPNFQECGTDLIGLTVAGDGMTPLGNFQAGHFGLVYGARLSILGGDWGGDDNSLFINRQTRNDNVIVNELYAGVEVARRCNAVDLHARLMFEMQNWHSDVLAQNAGLESIGIYGPALQLGAEY